MLTKFLDPKNDVAFRKIFGTEKNKDILIHFINDMITFKEGRQIVDATFLKTIQDPETAVKKTSIEDILCKDEIGNCYIVEMQVGKEKGFEKRAQYYASKAYVSQVFVGGEYHTLKEVIFLAISKFVVFPKKKGYKSDHVILDKHTLENDLKDFSFTFLELPKFKKKIDDLENMTDKWAYFFKNAKETSEKDLEKLIGQDTIMKRAFLELDRFSWNDEELLTYDQAEKYEGAYLASMAQQFDEGKAKGIEEGKAMGIEEGKAEREKLKMEGEKLKTALLKAAKNLCDQGLNIEQISEMTGLSIEEINSL